MKLKYIIAAILLLIVLTGCGLKEDLTQELCTQLKHSLLNVSDSKIYMDDGICILEKQDYTNIYSFECDSWSNKLNVIIKVNETDDTSILIDENSHWKIKLFCKLDKLR